jgi:hypothetical protein
VPDLRRPPSEQPVGDRWRPPADPNPDVRERGYLQTVTCWTALVLRVLSHRERDRCITPTRARHPRDDP